MKIYSGARHPGGTDVKVDRKDLAWCTDVRNHSPTGLEWGYGGSGPSQLALALLCDHFGDHGQALAYYDDFKWMIVAKVPPFWMMTIKEIDDTIARIKRERI